MNKPFTRTAVALAMASGMLLLLRCSSGHRPKDTMNTSAEEPQAGAVDSAAALPQSTASGEDKHEAMPARPADIPVGVLVSSVCITSNVSAYPIVVQPELQPSRPAPEELGYLDKTVITLPPTAPGNVVFAIWAKPDKRLRTRCALSRGNSYQVFMTRARALAVAPVEGTPP